MRLTQPSKGQLNGWYSARGSHAFFPSQLFSWFQGGRFQLRVSFPGLNLRLTTTQSGGRCPKSEGVRLAAHLPGRGFEKQPRSEAEEG